jgi:hypothetical protein
MREQEFVPFLHANGGTCCSNVAVLCPTCQAKHARRKHHLDQEDTMTIRQARGARNSSSDQRHLDSAHQSIVDAGVALGNRAPTAVQEYLGAAHDHIVGAGAQCDCLDTDTDENEPAHLAAGHTGYEAPDPYAVGVRALRIAQGIREPLDVGPDLGTDGYAVALAEKSVVEGSEFRYLSKPSTETNPYCEENLARRRRELGDAS